MKYLFKFMSDLKICTTSFSTFSYHFLSKSFGTSVDGEFGYFVVTSGYELSNLVTGKHLADNTLGKMVSYGLITKITNENVSNAVVCSYKGKDYKKPTVYCVTPFMVLLDFFDFLSTSHKSKKEAQIKYSIYDRFIKTVKSGKPIIVAILTSLNAHKYIAEKEKLPNFKDFATLVAGYYRAYKKITPNIVELKVA